MSTTSMIEVRRIELPRAQGIKALWLSGRRLGMRSSGILCHLTSLPSESGKGCIGHHAIRFLDVLQRRLKIMDSTAVSLCMDNSLAINVFNMKTHGNVIKFLGGERLGTMVT